jgi:uncharacterized protein DUF6471
MSASRAASVHSGRGDRVHPVEKADRDFWATRSKRFLQAELKRRGITYAGLAELMTENGLPETEGSITVKINRGGFPTWFFLAALNAIGCPQVRLEDV